MTVSGPHLFARFAYPPNVLGYCGPDDAAALLEQVGVAAEEAPLRSAAAKFEGAWPYLQLIAAANHIKDPLDGRVVEAYWIGNTLLDSVDTRLLGDSMDDRFRRRAGRQWDRLVAAVPAGARPHHNFHVFGVYPWLGLIRSGVVDEPLRVMDRCRIRWGRVEAALDGDGVERVVVRTRLLQWDGQRLALGTAQVEEAVASSGGLSLATPLQVGDWCALHWDWVCTRLTPVQVAALSAWTAHCLRTSQAALAAR